MKLVAAGACVTLVGLALLMAMVVRTIEPGLALSFVAYAALFAGMMMAIVGVVRRARGGR